MEDGSKLPDKLWYIIEERKDGRLFAVKECFRTEEEAKKGADRRRTTGTKHFFILSQRYRDEKLLGDYCG